MVGDIKAISPCVKSASAKLFLDLHTVSAPSGEERTRVLNAAEWRGESSRLHSYQSDVSHPPR